MEIEYEVQPDSTTHFVSTLHYGHKYDKTQEATAPHLKKLARAIHFLRNSALVYIFKHSRKSRYANARPPAFLRYTWNDIEQRGFTRASCTTTIEFKRGSPVPFS